MNLLKTAHLVALLLAVSGLFVLPAGARAQQPLEAIAAPRFDINRFEVLGNTLLTPAQVERAVAPHTGKGKDFADIQRALEALESAYRDAGWGLVQVVLPEQDITKGTVRFSLSLFR